MLAYANYLHSDPGLWRLTVDYLCTCGEAGKEMADEVLIRVPLGLNVSRKGKEKSREDKDPPFMAIDTDDQVDGDLSEIVKELNATCFEYERENARRIICNVRKTSVMTFLILKACLIVQIAARQLLESKKYGLAVSYCRSAEDWLGLGHIVNSLMDEYIVHGESLNHALYKMITYNKFGLIHLGSTRFVPYAAEIAPALQELRLEPGASGVFIQRLMFAVRYAEFQQRNLQGDAENAALDLISLFEEEIAPRSWWGVLLHDITPFLQDGALR